MNEHRYKSHGSGKFKRRDFGKIGKNVVIEPGVRVFHPKSIVIEDNVYIGYDTIIDANYRGKILIKSGAWIGPQCFINGLGGIEIGKNVGIGAGVKIITSSHRGKDRKIPIIDSELSVKEVKISQNSDIGIGAIILPGVTLGEGVQIGAGAVVKKNVPDFEVWAGVPAKKLKKRGVK